MDIRYCVEHVLMYGLFRQNFHAFLNAINKEKGNIMTRLYATAAKSLNKEEVPCDPNDFSFEFNRSIENNYFFFIINMPDKDYKTTYCSQIILSFDENASNPRYFTVEYVEDDNVFLLCEWNGNSHKIYAKLDKDKADIRKLIYTVRQMTKDVPPFVENITLNVQSEEEAAVKNVTEEVPTAEETISAPVEEAKEDKTQEEVKEEVPTTEEALVEEPKVQETTVEETAPVTETPKEEPNVKKTRKPSSKKTTKKVEEETPTTDNKEE